MSTVAKILLACCDINYAGVSSGNFGYTIAGQVGISIILVHQVVLLNFKGSIRDLQRVNGSRSDTYWPISIENHRRADDKETDANIVHENLRLSYCLSTSSIGDINKITEDTI